MKVLVFAPHPDDDIIGCGGSVAKHVSNGDSVSVVYMTSGDAGSLKYSKEELTTIREKEAENALSVIGVKDFVFLRNDDGYLEYNKENLIRVIELIRSVRPNLIYMPHKLDAHKDHSRTNEIVLEAIGRAGGPWFQECKGEPWNVESVLCYEVWTPLQDISYVEDISEFIELKIKALMEHKSQIADIAYDEAVKGLNRYRGAMTGKGKYCECFQVIKISSM